MPYDSTDIIEHYKQRGEWAELLFMARAAEHGLSILRPWGDSSPYDVALICPEEARSEKVRPEKACPERTLSRPSILRVQIKSTQCRHGVGAYKCHIDSNGVPYRPGLLDFIAAYVIPEQVWYIIPFAATHGQNEVLLAPHRPRSKYARYKEAWHLLQPAP
jgi:PD-(D/E)XK nuclease superfamily protein